ncbi:hypothetical protein DPMN_013841 [Dreissena polymorpha]|uniref:Uncharacterized protein n=1 Tax=Dreissena polymorpha TaxID=45954 RepID=A0A9D4N8C6_DREPO|nr:hypothetical protein DPMN_013841 [Dreissena polymorpha]
MPSDYVVESLGTLKVLMPRTVMAANRNPWVCFINVKETFATLRKNTLIAMACEEFSYLEGSQEPDVSYSNSGLNVSAVSENQLGEMKTSFSQLQHQKQMGNLKLVFQNILKAFMSHPLHASMKNKARNWLHVYRNIKMAGSGQS